MRQGLDAQGLTISNCPSAGSFVVQLTVAPEDVMFVTEIPETPGGVVSDAGALVVLKRTSTQKLPDWNV